MKVGKTMNWRARNEGLNLYAGYLKTSHITQKSNDRSRPISE
jgi:hypothetical protein